MNRLLGRSVELVWLAAALTACVPETRMLDVSERARRFEQAEELLSRSVMLMREGRVEYHAEARACLELASELSPHDPRMPDGLGSLAFREHDFRRAEALFKRAVELDPGYDRPYVHLALIAERHGDLSAARELLLTAIERDPLDYRARNNYAALLLDTLGKDPTFRYKARLELLKSSQLTPRQRDPIIEHNLGLSAGR